MEKTIVYDRTWTGTGLVAQNVKSNGPETISFEGHTYHRFVIHHSTNPCQSTMFRPGATVRKCRDCTLLHGCSKPGMKIVYRRVLVPGNPLYEAKIEQLYFGEEFINDGDIWKHIPGDYSNLSPTRA